MSTKLKILIVDDNEALCKNLADILEFKGFDTVGVFDGYQAINAIKNKNFDVVLMDIKMPGISGIDTLEQLKHVLPNIFIIIITAFADDQFYNNEFRSDNYQIIEKPIDIDKMLLMLNNINI